jgi:hypothetical protein
VEAKTDDAGIKAGMVLSTVGLTRHDRGEKHRNDLRNPSPLIEHPGRHASNSISQSSDKRSSGIRGDG